MSTGFTRQDLEDAFPASTISALINECLHMGWPFDPSQGRAEVERFLTTLGFLPKDLCTPIDLYAALNVVRQACWNGEQSLWTRYVESRRANVEKMSTPQSVCLHLTRTLNVGSNTGARRARLPLPIAHPAQPNTTWKILSSSCPIIDTREHPGALDLKVGGDDASFSVHIEYRADVKPQRQKPQTSPAQMEVTGIHSPFDRYQAVVDQLGPMAPEISPEGRLQTVWTLFLEKLTSGHLYHSTCTSRRNTPRTCFDCVTASWNFAECAESVGIPARVLSGVILNDFGPSPHFWCEVFLNGEWLPIDLYAWDLSRDDSGWASHFFLSLECRLRFELYPHSFSRFLPNTPWFIERQSAHGTSSITYRCQQTGQQLAQDTWALIPL